MYLSDNYCVCFENVNSLSLVMVMGTVIGMAVVMLIMGSSSPVITKLALLVGKVNLGPREDLDVPATLFLFSSK